MLTISASPSLLAQDPTLYLHSLIKLLLNSRAISLLSVSKGTLEEGSDCDTAFVAGLFKSLHENHYPAHLGGGIWEGIEVYLC